MIWIGTFLLIASALYALFILWCLYGWSRIASDPVHLNTVLPGVSVIVPVRNEEHSITETLNALTQQEYPKNNTEILVVDDCSVDATVDEIQKFIQEHPRDQIRLLRMDEKSAGSKKAAITLAIHTAKNSIILVTDGDCVVPETWIRTFVHAYGNNDMSFIAGPIAFHKGGGALGSVQSLEMMGLVGIAAAGIALGKPMMCNGANLSYTKQIFQDVNGFKDSKNRASGDDTQLLLKIAKLNRGKVMFLKDPGAIVKASPVHSWSQLWNQRKRWASKIPVALSSFTISVAVVAWFTHALLLLSSILVFFSPALKNYFFFALSIKLVSEFLLLYSLAIFFKRKSLLWFFIPAQPFYWIYITLIGVLSPFGRYQWKGRRLR